MVQKMIPLPPPAPGEKKGYLLYSKTPAKFKIISSDPPHKTLRIEPLKMVGKYQTSQDLQFFRFGKGIQVSHLYQEMKGKASTTSLTFFFFWLNTTSLTYSIYKDDPYSIIMGSIANGQLAQYKEPATKLHKPKNQQKQNP